MKFVVLLAFFTGVLSPASGVSADTLRIGYVNIQRIFRDAPAAAAAQKKIEAEIRSCNAWPSRFSQWKKRSTKMA